MTTDRNPDAPSGFGKRRRAEAEKAAPRGPTLIDRLRRAFSGSSSGSKLPPKNDAKRRNASRGG